jgi:hypothetical protein
VKAKVLFTAMMVFVLAGFLAGCAIPNFPDYLKTAKETRVDNVRGMRYCEIWFIGGNAITKDFTGQVFNTTGLNNKANPLDTCPDAMWAKVDAEALKKQYDALRVFKNGPRGWTMDWYALPISLEVRTFAGLEAKWYMTVDLSKDVQVDKRGGTAYKPTIGNRGSVMTFQKGKPVFILESPDGMPWVMQAWSMIVDPKLSYAELPNLGSKLKLPPGWKYRVKVLNQDLTIKAVNGMARVVQDELENTYDACFEEAGQKACSIQP